LYGNHVQRVSAFSGDRHKLVTHHKGETSTQVLPEGFFVTFRGRPGPNRMDVDVRAAFTKVLKIEEFKTANGVVPLPQMAHVEIVDTRSVPLNKWIILSRQGPLPAEAKLPPHVFFLAKFSVSR
jgi:hypothetical protein